MLCLSYFPALSETSSTDSECRNLRIISDKTPPLFFYYASLMLTEISIWAQSLQTSVSVYMCVSGSVTMYQEKVFHHLSLLHCQSVF